MVQRRDWNGAVKFEIDFLDPHHVALPLLPSSPSLLRRGVFVLALRLVHTQITRACLTEISLIYRHRARPTVTLTNYDHFPRREGSGLTRSPASLARVAWEKCIEGAR
jgi:hypothetical protein